MSEDLSLDMKVAVNVAHYCFERLHLKKQSELFPWDVLSLGFFLLFISDPNKTRKEQSSTYGKQIILPEGLVWCREQIALELKPQQSALGIANEYVLYGIVYSM